MTCIYLTGTYLYTCAAGSHVHVPGLQELAEYCTSEQCVLCPYHDLDELQPIVGAPQAGCGAGRAVWHC